LLDAYIGHVGILSRRHFTLTAIASFFLPRWAYAAPAEPGPILEWDDIVVDEALATLERLKRERIRFGAFEGYPVRFTDTEAWELVDGVWHPSPSEPYVVDILFGAHSLDEETFREEFGDVPPLPPTAFKRPASAAGTAAG
jgi:hypothetical protein